MTRSLVLGAVLGGVVVFVWTAVSWMLLPWHTSHMKSFTDEAAVAKVIMDNAPSGGMFAIPGMPAGYDAMSQAQKDSCMAATTQKMAAGPFFYGVVLRGAKEDMGRQMGIGLLFDVLAALLVTMLVMRTGGMSWAGRVMFIVTVALAVCLIAIVPNYIWWRHPGGYILVSMADVVIAWALAGMVIAKVAAPKRA